MLATDRPADRWKLDNKTGIIWEVHRDTRLPHADHLEMSGRKVSFILRYQVDGQRQISLSREVIWPMLRLKKDDVRGYLRRTYDSSAPFSILANGETLVPGPVQYLRFDGIFTAEHASQQGIAVTRTLFPSQANPLVFERWALRNTTRKPITIEVQRQVTGEEASGVYGRYHLETLADAVRPTVLPPGKTLTCGIEYRARLDNVAATAPDVEAEMRSRRRLLRQIDRSLRLETPDPILNRAFDFAKRRAAESIFETKMGLVHSPGGGRYYGGVWANDQAEYSGPFFPFLGDKTANEAALNAYRIFARAMKPDYHHLPSSFEVEGDVAWSGAGDRGDAAMIAYGASRYALERGEEKIARELWPAIQWCLEFCRRKTDAVGVVESDSDELEGRFPTGKANLSTSTLAYGAYRAAADLARALQKAEEAAEYDHRAQNLKAAIERYFGATVEGFPTYRYYEGNTVLRAWICLPLVMGLTERREGTIRALFSPRLWTPDGLATEAGDRVFWDRSTLYALRGVFTAGETETALRYLSDYSRRRLMGDHVPYPVEAYPEGGQAHLSAESALYCRIFTEGLFGITPTGFRSFSCLPRLPKHWHAMSLKNIGAFGSGFDLKVEREEAGIRVTVWRNGQVVFAGRGPVGQPFAITLP